MSSLIGWLTRSEVWRSIFRHGLPHDPKNQSLVMTSHFLTHIHPVRVKKHGLRFTYTFGLGGLSLACFLILAVSGAALMFYYVPSVDRAYGDMMTILDDVRFGWYMRNMHRWAAHFMVALVFLHMIRVFITGSYKGPRKFNWVVGVMLLVLTVLMSYTGYLLPWDQLAYWGVNVGTRLAGYIPGIGDEITLLLLGGRTIGQGALLRFYVLHVFLLPLALTFLMAIHFYRIRKDGGISDPPDLDPGEGE